MGRARSRSGARWPRGLVLPARWTARAPHRDQPADRHSATGGGQSAAGAPRPSRAESASAASPGRCRVGDHPQRVADPRAPRRRSRPPGGGWRPAGWSARRRPGTSRRRRPAPRRRTAPARPRCRPRAVPDHDRDRPRSAPTARPGPRRARRGLGGGAAAGGLTGQQQLPAAGVLLAAQQPGAGQQAPDGADDAQDTEAARP